MIATILERGKMSEIDLEILARAFRRTVYNAYGNTLIGSAPKAITDAYNRMKNPQVGDWVIESTTVDGMRHANATDLDGVGILEDIAQEKVDFGDNAEVWDEEVEGEPHPTETVYYIRTIDGRLFRWTNATIIAAPTWLAHDYTK